MRIGYVRPDGRMGEAPQRAVLEDSGITTIYVEEHDHTQRTLKWIVDRKIRTKAKDTVEVSDLHRICSDSEGIADHIAAITARGAVVVETRTGARSDQPGPFAKALHDSYAFLAGRLSRADRTRIAKLGAAASPVTKPKEGHMPLAAIQAIVNDHARFPTLDDAITFINRDKRYRRKINKPLIYRWARAKKIDMLRRVPGPKSVTD